MPYELADNVPDVFDVSVGYTIQNSPASNSYKAPSASPGPGPGYDSDITSFDAPIYDENSYTAVSQL